MSNVNMLEKDFVEHVFQLEMNVILQNEMMDLLKEKYEDMLDRIIPISIPKCDSYEISSDAMNSVHQMVDNLEQGATDDNRKWFSDAPSQFNKIVEDYKELESQAMTYQDQSKKENDKNHEQGIKMIADNHQLLDVHTKNLSVLWMQLNKVQQTLSETKEVLNQYYDSTDFLPNKKYHNVMTLSKLSEYFNDHRANTIGEALNVYNAEIQHQSIENKIDNVSLHLDKLDQQLQNINENQQVLYQAVQQGNHIMASISNEMNQQLDEMMNISRHAAQLDDKVQNLNNEITLNNQLMQECQRISDQNHQYTHELLEKYQGGYHG